MSSFIMSSVEELVGQVARLPDRIQSVRDDISEIEQELMGRISGCQARMDSLFGKVAQVVELFKEEYGVGGGGAGERSQTDIERLGKSRNAGPTINLRQESRHKRIPTTSRPEVDLSSDDGTSSETSDSDDDDVREIPPVDEWGSTSKSTYLVRSAELQSRRYNKTKESTNSVSQLPPHQVPWSLETFRRKFGGGGGGEGGGGGNQQTTGGGSRQSQTRGMPPPPPTWFSETKSPADSTLLPPKPGSSNYKTAEEAYGDTLKEEEAAAATTTPPQPLWAMEAYFKNLKGGGRGLAVRGEKQQTNTDQGGGVKRVDLRKKIPAPATATPPPTMVSRHVEKVQRTEYRAMGIPPPDKFHPYKPKKSNQPAASASSVPPSAPPPFQNESGMGGEVEVEEDHLPRTPDIEHFTIFHGTSATESSQGGKTLHHCFCGRRNYELQAMVAHFVERTVGSKFQCRFCRAKFVVSHGLVEHCLKAHKMNTFPCQFCFREMNSQEELEFHLHSEVSGCGGILQKRIRSGQPYKYMWLM